MVHDPLMRFAERRIQRALNTGRILPFVVLSITAVVFLFGIIMWLVDPKDFPSLGLALWWAVSTVTTVGYGDVVPTTPGGRFVATGLMIFGFASLSLLTGIVASLLVSRRTVEQSHDTMRSVEDRLAKIERLLQQRGAD